MKKFLISILLPSAMLLLFLAGCQLDQIEEVTQVPQEKSPVKITLIEKDIPAARLDGEGLCGEVLVNPMYSLNWKKTVGYTSVANDENNLYVNFETENDYKIKRIFLYVGPSELLPVGGWGIPRIGQFPYQEVFNEQVIDHTITIPLEELGEDVAIAAFVIVSKMEKFGRHRFLRLEGAWAFGDEQLGRYWGLGWIQHYTIQECTPPPPPVPVCMTAWKEGPNSYEAGPDQLGWYDTYVSREYTIIKDFYAGSGLNDIKEGQLVGRVYVSYFGAAGRYDLVVYYEITDENYRLTETNLYVNEFQPPVLSPEMFPYKKTGLNALSDSYVFQVEYEGEPSPDLYISAEALICPVE